MLGAVVCACVLCVQFAAAPSAKAAFFLDPATGDYQYFDSGGHAAPREITPDEFNQIVNESVAAQDEAMGATIPTDIPASTAAQGATLWDRLAGAGQALKSAAMDVLGGAGDFPLFDSIGSAALPTLGVGVVGYVGWHIGSDIASILGIDGGGSAPSSCNQCVAEVENGQLAVDRGFDLCDMLYDEPRPGTPLTSCPSGTNPGGCGSCTPGPSNGPQFTPTSGWVLEFSATGPAWNLYNDSIPSGVAQITPQSDEYGCHLYTLTNYSIENTDGQNTHVGGTDAIFCPAEFTALPGPGQSTSFPEVGSINGTATSKTEAQQKADTSTCLQGQFASPRYQGFNDSCTEWGNYVCTQPDSPCRGATVTTNNDTVTIPQITPNETYEAYKQALRQAGLLGQVDRNVLTAGLADPSVQPDDVVSVDPSAGTAVTPQASVTVSTNPDSSGGTTTGGGGPVGPSLPGIAIPSAATPCNVFPFGIPCWLHDTVGGALVGGPVAPAFSFSTPSMFGGGNVNVNLGSILGVNTDALMSVFRPVLLFVSLVVLVLWLSRLALGSGGGPGGGGGGEED